MAALTLEEDQFDLKKLGQYVARELPKYAIPIWIRIMDQNTMQVTGTYKHIKVFESLYLPFNVLVVNQTIHVQTGLRAEGMDIRKYKDKVFMFDEATSTYKPFGLKEYQDVVAGKVKL